MKEYGMNYANLMIDISKNIKIHNDLFYKKMFDAMKKETVQAVQVYENKIQKMRQEHTSTISYVYFTVSALWIKTRSLLGI